MALTLNPVPTRRRGLADMDGKETEMQELMPREVAATVPPPYATEDEADPSRA